MQVGKGRPKNTKKQQKVRGSKGQRPRSQAKPKKPERGNKERWAGQRSSNKEQEPSLAAHSEQLKTKNADRQTEKRGSNGRARRVYCKLAKAGQKKAKR